mmetsp:Transcript_29721/g.79045  ORF Transcript_29721/g.79045 Transcript_29721/m.79045 type:complete len:313 (-) Transcript_29721:26-964(-)
MLHSAATRTPPARLASLCAEERPERAAAGRDSKSRALRRRLARRRVGLARANLREQPRELCCELCPQRRRLRLQSPRLLLQAVQLGLGGTLALVVTRAHDHVAERVLHQHAARESIARAEGVALRGEDALGRAVLHAANLIPRYQLLARAVPPVEVDGAGRMVLKDHGVVDQLVTRAAKRRLVAIDKRRLRALAVLEFDYTNAVLEQQPPVARLAGAEGARAPDVAVQRGQAAAEAGAEEAVRDLVALAVDVEQLDGVRRSVAEVHILEVGLLEVGLRLEAFGRRRAAGRANAGAQLGRAPLRRERGSEEES